MARSALLNVMVAAATKAGRFLARDFGEVQNLQVSSTAPEIYVNKTYNKASSILHAELSKARSGYSFLMKNFDEKQDNKDENLWIVDPLDGKVNFLHGVPIFSISIALQRQKHIVAAVVYNPATGEIYTAEKGNGAFMNDRRLRVAGRERLEDFLIGVKIPKRISLDYSNQMIHIQNIISSGANISCLGSSALGLAWVAAGRIDGYIEQNSAPWNSAAGVLLIREAGGFVFDLKTNQPVQVLESEKILAGNQKIQNTITYIMNKNKNHPEQKPL